MVWQTLTLVLLFCLLSVSTIFVRVSLVFQFLSTFSSRVCACAKSAISLERRQLVAQPPDFRAIPQTTAREADANNSTSNFIFHDIPVSPSVTEVRSFSWLGRDCKLAIPSYYSNYAYVECADLQPFQASVAWLIKVLCCLVTYQTFVQHPSSNAACHEALGSLTSPENTAVFSPAFDRCGVRAGDRVTVMLLARKETLTCACSAS